MTNQVAGAEAKIQVLDLFSGAGGMALGFLQAGMEPVLALDSNAPAIATYRANFGDHAHCIDIRDVDTFPHADVIIGGPPCQGFSRLGKQARLARPENDLWREYMRCVEAVRPLVFVLENVPDFLKDPAYQGVVAEASRLGYAFVSNVLNAADYGVPQKRRRAILIGSRIGMPFLPEPTHHDPSKTPLPGLAKWRTVRDAIGDLPLTPTNVDRHDQRNSSSLVLERYSHVPPGGNRKSVPEHLLPNCWRNQTWGSGGSTDLLGRLTWDSPALTIRTEFHKPEKGCYLHPEANRPITVREGARLQTFPDDFAFVGSNVQVAKQIGNAVPVELARKIALCIRPDVERAKAGEPSL